MGKPTVIVMAAGMGSRYGGLKQMDPVGPEGKVILDYSLYDAARAGFEKAVLLISKKIEKDFRELVGKRIEKRMDVSYAFQELDRLPDGFSLPQGREKPWGTGHAVACCRREVGDAPFAVINADDYYGMESFPALYRFLSQQEGQRGKYAMVGYELGNTLTENGSVSRGVCQIGKDGMLLGITERTKIVWDNGVPCYWEGEEKTPLSPDTTVSMNFWGFTPDFMEEVENRFSHFLTKTLRENPLKGEYFLPFVVNELLEEKKVTVQVLHCPAKWYGVTYREDRPVVEAALRRLTQEGAYPVSF